MIKNKNYTYIKKNDRIDGKYTIENYFIPPNKQEFIEKTDALLSVRKIKSICRMRPCEGLNKTFYKFPLKTKANQDESLSLVRSSFNKDLFKEYKNKLSFSKIYDEEYTQIEIFSETCMDLVDNLIECSKSSFIFCHGPKNSGKTHTLIGDVQGPGLIPLSLRIIHDKIKSKNNKKFEISCNYFEIFDENVNDLLTKPNSETKKMTHLVNQAPYISFEKLINFRLNTIENFSEALNRGNAKKKMKCKESQSTVLFVVTVRAYSEDLSSYKDASITFVDLESNLYYKMSKFETNKDGAKNDTYYLSKIIKHLETPKTTKTNMGYTLFTNYLKSIFYANIDVLIITNINPSLNYSLENLNVLEFGNYFANGLNNIDKYFFNNEEISFDIPKLHSFKHNIKKLEKGEKFEEFSNKISDVLEVKKNDKVIKVENNFKFEDFTDKNSVVLDDKKNEKILKTEIKLKSKDFPDKNSILLSVKKTDKVISMGSFEDEFENLKPRIIISNTQLNQMKTDYDRLYNLFEKQEKIIENLINDKKEISLPQKGTIQNIDDLIRNAM